MTVWGSRLSAWRISWYEKHHSSAAILFPLCALTRGSFRKYGKGWTAASRGGAPGLVTPRHEDSDDCSSGRSQPLCVHSFPARDTEVRGLIIWVRLHGHGHFWGRLTPRNPGGVLVTDGDAPLGQFSGRLKVLEGKAWWPSGPWRVSRRALGGGHFVMRGGVAWCYP